MADPDLVASLAQIDAFSDLEAGTLATLAAAATRVTVPDGATVLEAGQAGRFMALLDGRIEVAGVVGPSGGDRQLEPGAVFPVNALMARRGVSSAYVARQACRCLAWPAETFEALYAAEAGFRAHCSQLIEQLAALSLERLQGARAVPGDALLATRLGDALGRAPVSVAPTASLRESLELMRRERVGSVIVADADGRPQAILTLQDVLQRVATQQPDLARPVTAFASPIRWTASADAPALEAAMLMARHGVRHIPVLEGERLAGVVSEGQLYAIQHGGLRKVASRIRHADGLEDLRAAGALVRELVAGMMEQSSDAEPITRLVSSLNDSIAVRAIELAEREFALPDVPWAWIALGSEGREEQTLATDQDNGIVFEATEPGPVREAFLPFARRVNDLLDAAGFALCKGQIMAGNPRWCLASEEWRACFASWIDVPQPQALLHAAIFFDFRAVHGDVSLVARLRAWLDEQVAGNDRFLLLMANNALQNQPPLGLIRDFVLTGTREHKGKLDLKVNGVQLFVEAARIYALANGVDAGNTIERLRASAPRARIPAVEAEAWIEAFRFLQTLRLRLNVEQVRAGAALHNFLAPASLNELDRTVLRESMRQARRLQARLTRDYGGGARSLG